MKPAIKSASQLNSRLERFQNQLLPTQVVLLSDQSDILYFAGFEQLVPHEREAFLLITFNQAWLHHASFSPITIQTGIKNIPHCNLKSVVQTLNHIKSQNNLKSLLIDESSLFVDEYQKLHDLSQLTLMTFDKNLIWQVRMIKDRREQAALRRAGQITHQIMTQIQTSLKVGQSELMVKEQIEHQLKKNQALPVAFPIIVAFGAHTALPHHQPTHKKLRHNMPVLLDFGATVKHYKADMTRTFWFGKKPSRQFNHLKAAVEQAYLKAFIALKSRKKTNLTAQALDQITRESLKKDHLSQFFIHTTGHGLGLDIHEPPSLNYQNQQILQPMMAITIEPGVYLPNQLGYRYENTVLITAQGVTILT